jgi:hypothetical protein
VLGARLVEPSGKWVGPRVPGILSLWWLWDIQTGKGRGFDKNDELPPSSFALPHQSGDVVQRVGLPMVRPHLPNQSSLAHPNLNSHLIISKYFLFGPKQT